MDDLMKYYETSADITYVLGEENQSIVSIPKNLANNIKIFTILKDKSLFEHNRNNIMNEIYYISKMINNGNNDAIYIVSFVKSELISNGNDDLFSKEIDRIKEHINIAYNNLIKGTSLNRENFVRKVQLVSLDKRFSKFINWICMKYSKKFRAVNYQPAVNVVLNEQKNKNPMFINNNSASIFNEPNRQSAIIASMQANVKPVTESLSIGTPKNRDLYVANSTSSSGSGPTNTDDYYNTETKSNNNVNVKTMVKKTPVGGQGFIKWPTIIYMVVIAFIFGYIATVLFLK